jgi:hypothetical protein
MAEINAEGQSNANIAGTCIPNNIINPLTVSIIHTDVTINGAYDGTALAQPMGGVAPYTYRWIDGDTNQMRFNLAAGVYLCMVTDSVGTLATAQVTIDQPAVTFWNTYKEGSYRKNDCGSGKMGSVVIYQVAAHTFSSTISQADADAKAVADIEANGQAFANNTGTCTSIATGTLTIINNVIGNWTLSVAHGYKAPYNITNASSSPATVDVMSAYVTFSGPASYVLFNGSSIPKDTPCLVTFLSRNFLTIN